MSNELRTVRVTLSVEVSPQAWSDCYGSGMDFLTNAVDRDDVREYVKNLVVGSAAFNEGAITDVEIRP